MNSQAEIEEQNKEIVMKWFREVNKENFEELFEELFASDCQQRMPPNAEPRDSEEFRALVDEFYTAFPKVEHTVGEIVAEGDKVAAIITVHAAHEGEQVSLRDSLSNQSVRDSPTTRPSRSHSVSMGIPRCANAVAAISTIWTSASGSKPVTEGPAARKKIVSC